MVIIVSAGQNRFLAIMQIHHIYVCVWPFAICIHFATGAQFDFPKDMLKARNQKFSLEPQIRNICKHRMHKYAYLRGYGMERRTTSGIRGDDLVYSAMFEWCVGSNLYGEIHRFAYVLVRELFAYTLSHITYLLGHCIRLIKVYLFKSMNVYVCGSAFG